MGNLLNGVKVGLRNLKKDLTKYSPEILAGFGIAGFFMSTGLAIKATIKSVDEIRMEDRFDHQEPFTNKEKIKLVWKNYIPTGLTATTSTLCIIASVTESRKRGAVLAAAYKLAEESLYEYRDKVREVVGDKKVDEIDSKIAQDKLDNATEPSINIINNVLDKTIMSKTIPGTTLFYEPLTNTYFYADINEFKREALNAREEELEGPDGYLGVVSWLCQLGISDYIPDDALAGWQLTGWSCADQFGSVNISFKAVTAKIFNDAPCLMITYDKNPINDYYNYYK